MLGLDFSLILFASFDPIVVKYSLIIVAMDCWSLTGTSSEIMHDWVVLDLSRGVISFKDFQRPAGLSLLTLIRFRSFYHL